MELLLSASLIAAFIAGVAALFAPCCITVLLPAYFASIFREKYKIFLMTFIFFLGILAVFLPIGLGIAALGSLFSRYHNLIFAGGGVFLAILGIVLITGWHFSLPFKVHPSLAKHSAFSVFGLGIFSGIATTCCAPVLAGVMTLAALPGSIAWGGVYTLSYVFGMVAPLFLISLFLDKIDFAQKFSKILQRPVGYSLMNRKITITVSEAVSGIAFLIMGVLISYLAYTNRLFVHSEYQVSVNIFITKILDFANGFLGAVPEYMWAILLFVAIVFITRSIIAQLKKEKYEKN